MFVFSSIIWQFLYTHIYCACSCNAFQFCFLCVKIKFLFRQTKKKKHLKCMKLFKKRTCHFVFVFFFFILHSSVFYIWIYFVWSFKWINESVLYCCKIWTTFAQLTSAIWLVRLSFKQCFSHECECCWQESMESFEISPSLPRRHSAKSCWHLAKQKPGNSIKWIQNSIEHYSNTILPQILAASDGFSWFLNSKSQSCAVFSLRRLHQTISKEDTKKDVFWI